MTRFYACAGLLVLALFSGCGKTLEGLGKPLDVKEYTLKGEVREVDENNRTLVIRHEDIPGFMVAMTMPFRMPEGTDFTEFQPGDHVEGKLRVKSKAGNVVDYEVVGMSVVKPAVKTLDLQDLTKGTPKVVAQTTRLQPGDVVPDFTMLDQDGTTRKLSDLRGSVVVLTFIYTRCPLPEFCPAMDRKFADLARAVSATASRASHVRLVSLSFDPDNDTPEVLRKHAAIRGAVPPVWTYASATHDDLARIAPLFGLMFGPVKSEIVHNLCTAVIGPDGKLVRLDVGTRDNAWTTADMLKTVAGALPDGSSPSKAD
ncbi:SCO family protein [Paludisphaera rhizosphaerae]|uniref:SCO family protein n=1 Tax=Paludisphaera rhizosphaerae TaxID=2711216 RepID=UPI0013EB8A20|nr:SCO family protein [Paludisphaera rhizosphaerae]